MGAADEPDAPALLLLVELPGVEGLLVVDVLLAGAALLVEDPAPESQDVVPVEGAEVVVVPGEGLAAVPEPEALVDGVLAAAAGVEVAGALQVPPAGVPVVTAVVLVVVGEAVRACRFAPAPGAPTPDLVPASAAACGAEECPAAVVPEEALAANVALGLVAAAAGGTVAPA